MILKRNTAAALDKELARLAADEAALAEVNREHEAKLPDAEDSELVELEDKATAFEKLIARRRSKIALLMDRLAGEATVQREQDYKAWAARVEAALPACRAADEKYERAKIAIGEAIKEIVQSRENALRVYREGDCQPQTVFVGYYLSSEPLASDIQRTWQIDRGYADRYRPPSPSEYLTRGCDVGPRGYLTAMRERLDEFVHGLRHAHDPAPVEPETEVKNENAEAAA
jgi:hypothetical protein